MKKYCLDGEIASFDYHSESGAWAFCGPKSLKAFLDGCHKGEKVEIEINSPGGSVVYGIEMANAIKNSGVKSTAHVTGIAASMASVIACACDEIVMEEASFMMIHDPWGFTEGNADEMRKEAKLLDQMKAVIMSFYRGKFEGKSDEEISALMKDETWYTGNECLENGLKCSVVKSDVKIAAKIGAHNFAKAPEAVKALYGHAEIPAEIQAEIDKAKEESAAIDGNRQPSTAIDKDTDWEARFKGASKKINEITAERDAALTERDALAAQIEDFKNQLGKSEKDLAEANAKVSELSASLDEKAKALETAEKDLATARDNLKSATDQVEHLKATRDVLTAGVLTPGNGDDTYAAKMAAAKTPEERENLRAQKKAGKIK